MGLTRSVLEATTPSHTKGFSEQALTQVVAEAYRLGVSTRRVDDLVKALGIEGIDKSQVSAMSQTLDQRVKKFRERPLEASAYPYVWVDALYIKVREGGRISGVAVAIATGVTREGKREILGLETFTQEDEEAWTHFLRGLARRDLSHTQLVVSDTHLGLKAAIQKVMPSSSWQRCRTHFMKNLLCHVAKTAQELVATLVRAPSSRNPMRWPSDSRLPASFQATPGRPSQSRRRSGKLPRRFPRVHGIFQVPLATDLR